MTTMALSVLFGLLLAGQGKATAPPVDWPLRIAGAPQAEVHRLLGRPRDAFASEDRRTMMDYYTLPENLDVRIAYGSGRVQAVTIVFPKDPKDWRDALAKAGIASGTARSARASRHSREPVLVIDGLRGLRPGWGVLYSPTREILEAAIPRQEEANLQFVAPGLWKR